MPRTVLLVFLLSLAVSAQNATPTAQRNQGRANLTDQKACYQQARQYVLDKDGTASKLASYDNSLFTLDQAHYEPKTQTCYVQTRRSQPSYPPESTIYGMVETIQIADAFEGKEIAVFVGGYIQDKKAGGLKWDAPSECRVNGEKCTSRPTFNDMLWKLIPAFRPAGADGEMGR
jgi:hypothetical protein